MTFSTIVPARTKKHANGTGVSASLQKLGKAPARLCLTFQEPTLERLGLRYGKTLDAAIGWGADAGKVRIRAGTDFAIQKRNGTGKNRPYALCDLGVVDVMPDRKESSQWVEVAPADDGWLEVSLPEWAQPKSQSVASGSSSKGRRPALDHAVAVSGRRPNNHTARVLGDPPPGRSALAGKH